MGTTSFFFYTIAVLRTKVVKYYPKRVAAFDRLRKELNLEKLSAKEFLDAVEAETTKN